VTLRCLLTSFQPWLPHHQSNASDDLIEILTTQEIPHLSLFFLRQLPVDITLATQQVLQEVDRSFYEIIICCGMAESRTNLTIESNANYLGEQIHCSIDLKELAKELTFTTISHDAGRFVCEGLYFQILNYLKQKQIYSSCLFLHIPILTPKNRDYILNDVMAIIQKLARLNQSK
jgi:pyroglutamyl-peptidase